MPDLEKRREPNMFAEYVPELSEIDTKTAQVMEGLRHLGVQFAEIMQERQMPVDEAIVGKDARADTEQEYVWVGKRLPVWLVLNGTNLTGNSMFHGSIGTESYSRSLGSGTPNNFRTDYKYFDSQKHFNNKLKTMNHPKDTHATERAIGLAANGEFVGLSREGDSKYGTFIMPSKFSVAEKTLKPSDFFELRALEPDTNVEPEGLIGTMKVRMLSAIEQYSEKRTQELAQLEEGQTIVRPADYYQPKDDIFRLAKRLEDTTKRRKVFGIF